MSGAHRNTQRRDGRHRGGSATRPHQKAPHTSVTSPDKSRQVGFVSSISRVGTSGKHTLLFSPPSQPPPQGGRCSSSFFERLVSHMHDATPSPLAGRGETKQGLSIPLNPSTCLPGESRGPSRTLSTSSIAVIGPSQDESGLRRDNIGEEQENLSHLSPPLKPVPYSIPFPPIARGADEAPGGKTGSSGSPGLVRGCQRPAGTSRRQEDPQKVP
jgi:hypothetical protein